jgi:plastocyanin
MTLGRAVDIVDFGYDPETITVAVDETVTWANTGATTHTVTFTGGPDCGNVASNAGISRTFDTAGTFEYICTIHPQMTGTVVVQ